MSDPMNTLTESAPSAPTPSSAEPMVKVTNLHRRFDTVHAVKGISFEIYPGQVVGFIGANGAGKTTTMRMMATLERPTKGKILIGGADVLRETLHVRQIVGWMPDNYGTYANMNVFEYLDFFARAYGLKGAKRNARVEEIMDFADLTVMADRPVNKLSKGMGQRLCFGRMLLPDPQFLILDEPAAGLDPKARIEFKNLVRLLAQQGKTLFISSHILSELGEMCDTLLFIDAGTLVYHGAAEALRRGTHGQQAGAELHVVDVGLAGESGQPFKDWVSMQAGMKILEMRRDGARLELTAASLEVLAEHLRRMVQAGLPVVEFHRVERKLEDAFVDMVKGLHPAGNLSGEGMS
ncbi:MAG: ABC transporter ATP-binding protein [Verrucomicrobiales bacterium]|nr:ABC transporter ATP-binding protein [Verrucomicrobiales bacterium]